MSPAEKTQKTMEVKIRNLATKTRLDQQGLARVYLTQQALSELGVEKPGQLIHLWKTGHDSFKEAIAWNTAEKSLKKNVAQVASEYREFLGFKLEDEVNVRAGGLVPAANSIVLRELAASDGEGSQDRIAESERAHWVWFLHAHLSKSDVPSSPSFVGFGG